MKKTLSELKREAKSKEFEAKILRFHGNKENISIKLQGWRNLTWQGNSLKFIRNDGTQSYAQIEYSSLIDYNDDILKLYSPSPNNPKEKGEEVLVYKIRRKKHYD